MVSVSLILSSAWNYCPFQNWNLVHFISRWLYKAFYVIFISTALQYCTTVIWSSVCVLWDRHDTWKLKTGSSSGIQRGTAGEKGKKKQWVSAQRSGWREKGRKKQDETSESCHAAQSENSFHQYERQLICINLLLNTIELCCISGLAVRIAMSITYMPTVIYQ